MAGGDAIPRLPESIERFTRAAVATWGEIDFALIDSAFMGSISAIMTHGPVRFSSGCSPS